MNKFQSRTKIRPKIQIRIRNQIWIFFESKKNNQKTHRNNRETKLEETMKTGQINLKLKKMEGTMLIGLAHRFPRFRQERITPAMSGS
jgi:hypothetical protein